MSEYFTTIIIFDFEYEIAAGELPAVLCMVAYVLDNNLQHVSTLRLWRGEFGGTPTFDTGPDTLFVAYSAWAEMTCFHGPGLEISRAHFRSAHRLLGGEQYIAAA